MNTINPTTMSGNNRTTRVRRFTGIFEEPSLLPQRWEQDPGLGVGSVDFRSCTYAENADRLNFETMGLLAD